MRPWSEMCSGSEAGSYLRRIDFFITPLKAQGPSRTCNESKEEKKPWSRAVPMYPSGPMEPRVQRDWYFIAEQPAPETHVAHPEGCAALRIVLVTVPRVSRSCEHFPDGFDLHSPVSRGGGCIAPYRRHATMRCLCVARFRGLALILPSPPPWRQPRGKS